MEEDISRIDTLYQRCMDWRLNGVTSMRMGRGTSVQIANEGANVGSVRNSIRDALENYPNITNVVILPHSDCGAMKVVTDVLNGAVAVDAEVEEKLVRPFRNEIGSLERGPDGKITRESVERANYRIQEREMKALLVDLGRQNISVTVNPTDVTKITNLPMHPPGTPVPYAVLVPISAKTPDSIIESTGKTPYKAYMLAGNPEDLGVAAKVASALKVNDIAIPETDQDAQKSRAFFEGLGATVEICKVTGKTPAPQKNRSF